MKILITGGAGFIGSSIARRLVKDGHSVRIIDNLSTGKKENIQDILDSVEFIEGDIREYKIVERAVDGCEAITHQAALPSVPRSIEEPLVSNNTNIDGTLYVLEAARQKGVRRIVYAASSSVYGDTEELPKVETMSASPLSPYALQKYAGEMYCKYYTNFYGLETVALRYFNIFGPYQDPDSQYSAVVPLFVNACLNNEPPTIYGDGEQSRDFTYISNVVDANVAALTMGKKLQGESINISGGKRITINKLFSIIKKITKSNIEPKYGPPREGDVRDSLADLSRAREVINYIPQIGVKEGLERTVVWYKERHLKK